jgi:cobalt-zinc-cadmium efflux system protein
VTDHADRAPDSAETRILAALLLTIAGMVVSVVGGLHSRSLALLSDAGHMLADAAALGLALVAQKVASRPRTGLRTYGWRRAETLAAFVNAILLGVASVWIVLEAIERWQDPPDVRGGFMLAVAIFGLLVNLAAAAILSAGHSHNANTRAALAHVAADAAGSLAAIVAAALVLGLGWRRADSLISIVLAAMIFWGAWRLVVRTVDVLMEGTPKGLEPAALEATIRGTAGVSDLHDLHASTISEGFDVVTVHVTLDGTRHGTDVSQDVGERIRVRHGIDHATVQAEHPRSTGFYQPISTLGRRRDPAGGARAGRPL